MNREKIESCLGKHVKIKLWSDDIAEGILVKGDGFENKYYSCSFNSTGGRFWFRASHVRELEIL